MSSEAQNNSGLNTFIKILLAIFLPPLGVLFTVGLSKHFWINVVLTLFGFVPGIVHAVYIIAKKN